MGVIIIIFYFFLGGCIIIIFLQYSTVQYSTVQYSTVQYSTVQYNTLQYRTQYSTVQSHPTPKVGGVEKEKDKKKKSIWRPTVPPPGTMGKNVMEEQEEQEEQDQLRFGVLMTLV